jgi:hypothetical protein
MRDPEFQQAASELLAQAGNKPRLARETGMAIYYNASVGEFYYLGIRATGFKGQNGFFDFGNPARSFPGGWQLIGLAHSHPFPGPGLGPPGQQDIQNGQPFWPFPWYVVAGPNQNGPPSIFGLVQGTVLLPGCRPVTPGPNDFDANGGIIIR